MKIMINPWLVDTIEEFSFYCCPECTFKSNEPIYFQNHAIKNHDLSKSFFDNANLDETKVKLENIEAEAGSQIEYLSETQTKVNSSSLLKEEKEQNDQFEDDLNNFDDAEDLQGNNLSHEIEVFCQECNVKVLKTNFWRHLRTKVHKENTGDHEKAKSDTDTNYESAECSDKVISSKKVSRKNLNNKNIKKVHKHNSKENYNKGKSSSFVEDQNIWNLDFFSKMNERQLETYKYNWGSFCKLSYHNQQNPPTEEMYVDFIEKKKEAGRTDKGRLTSKGVYNSVRYSIRLTK